LQLKKYLDQLDNIEKSEAATNSLFKEWEKRQEKRQYNEAYNMGLVLIDLLINQVVSYTSFFSASCMFLCRLHIVGNE